MCGSDPSRLVYRRSTDAVSLAKFTVIRRALSRQPIPATPRLLRQRLTLLRRHIGGATECIKIIRTIGLTDPSVVPRPFDGAPDRQKSPAWNCGARNGRLHQGLRECLQNGNVHPFTGTPRDCASAPLRHLVRQNLVVLCISGVDVYLRRRKATAANEPHVAGPRRLTSCEPICGLLTRHPRRPIAWSRQTVLPQTRGDEASRAQVRRPSRRKKSMSEGSVPET